jgi:hypothetical protein
MEQEEHAIRTGEIKMYTEFQLDNLKRKVIWEDNTELDLKEIGSVRVYWIKVTQVRVQWRALANTIMNLRVP